MTKYGSQIANPRQKVEEGGAELAGSEGEDYFLVGELTSLPFHLVGEEALGEESKI